MTKNLYRSLVLLATFSFYGTAQNNNLESIKTTVQANVDISELRAQLDEISQQTYMPCHAIGYSADLKVKDAFKHGTSYYWKIQANDLAIKAFLDVEPLPLGDTVFIKNIAGEKVQYLTRDNLLQNKWSSKVVPEEIVIQYKSHNSEIPQIRIRSYSLQELPKGSLQTDDFGDSQFCEVNMNCSEGNNYQDVKNSVVRILVKVDNAYFWCTGSLINNTTFDHAPYILTAEHCALNGSKFSSAADLKDWEFYFQYESPNCSNPPNEGNLASKVITGASMLARSNDQGGTTGSDFLLLELDLSFNNGLFPPSIQPYFAGWNRLDIAPASGVAIHHPEGDIKKISTSTQPALSGEYTASASNTHWIVYWNATANGHGVTEGGSSGGAFFNGNREITGTLTGGFASCSFKNDEDFYGKFSYHWDQNGNTPNRRLKDWLDPLNTNVTSLSGTTLSDSAPPYDSDLISIAPNPVQNGKMYINGLYEVGSEIIEIYNLQGEKVYPKFDDRPAKDIMENGYLAVDHLANGPYVLRIISNQGTDTYKFVIQ